eukprot:6488807-Amphidinium_carterae.1
MQEYQHAVSKNSILQECKFITIGDKKSGTGIPQFQAHSAVLDVNTRLRFEVCSTDGQPCGCVLMQVCTNWGGKLPALVPKSSCEAELLASTGQWHGAEGLAATNSYEASSDNTASLQLLNAVHPPRSVHISVRGERLRQWNDRGMRLMYVPTDQQIADSLTKGLVISDKVRDQLHMISC